MGVIGAGGRLDNARNGHLTFYGGSSGDAEAFFFVPGQKVYLDQFNRPIVYVPRRNYDDGFGTMVPNETSFYNPVSCQVFSFGADGKSVQTEPGSLSYTDGIDNDGDGRIDQADNPKTSTADGKQVEDDLTNW